MSAISMESLTFKDFVSKGQFEVYKSTPPRTTWRERRWKSCSASETRVWTTTNGCRTSRWPLAGKKNRSNSSTPSLVMRAAADAELKSTQQKAKKETQLAVSEVIRARIKSVFESQWTTFEKLCSSAKIAKADMAVAQLATKHCLAIRELAEGIPETRKAGNPEFVLRAMGALALFDHFKSIFIREGHKLNLVTADESDGGKPDAPVDPEEQEISK